MKTDDVLAVDWNKQADRDRLALRGLANGNIITNNLFCISKISVKSGEYVCVEILPRTTGAYGREMYFFGAKAWVDKKELKIAFPDGEIVVLGEDSLRDVDMLEIEEGFWAEKLREQREEATWEE